MTRWVDTHCHLHLGDAEPAALVNRAAAAGVGWMVNPGTDAASSEESFRLAGRFPGVVFPTAGLHPHDASRWPAEADRIAALAVDAVAVGECGLDFYRNLSPPEDQVTAFRDQLRLAERVDKPVIVHCRDAFAEVHDLLESTGCGPRAVLHCWTGGPRWTKRLAALGVTFSFAGPVAFATGDTVRRGAAEAPPDRTMVETDSPYLTPPPGALTDGFAPESGVGPRSGRHLMGASNPSGSADRSVPNEPANVVRVGAALAAVWGITVDAVAVLTTATATRVFRGG